MCSGEEGIASEEPGVTGFLASFWTSADATCSSPKQGIWPIRLRNGHFRAADQCLADR